jgi:hypothetical protein
MRSPLDKYPGLYTNHLRWKIDEQTILRDYGLVFEKERRMEGC